MAYEIIVYSTKMESMIHISYEKMYKAKTEIDRNRLYEKLHVAQERNISRKSAIMNFSCKNKNKLWKRN